jgi:hypothetical protein
MNFLALVNFTSSTVALSSQTISTSVSMDFGQVPRELRMTLKLMKEGNHTTAFRIANLCAQPGTLAERFSTPFRISLRQTGRDRCGFSEKLYTPKVPKKPCTA